MKLKTILWSLAAAGILTGLAACSDDDGNKNGGTDITSITMTAEPDHILSNGTDMAVFTVRTSTGNNVTENSDLVITNVTAGTAITGYTFTSTTPGTYQFKASYQGHESETISVVVVSEEEIDFQYNMTVHLFTGVQCVYCPYSKQRLQDVKDNSEYGDRMNLMAWHVNIPSADPMTIPASALLTTELGVNSAPTIWLDMQTVGNYVADYDPKMLRSQIDGIFQSEAKERAFAGVKINSSLSGNDVSVDVTVKAGVSTEYTLMVVVVEDGVIGTQTMPNGSVEDPYTHDYVVRQVISAGVGDALGNVLVGQEVTKSYSATLNNVTNAANCRVIAYVRPHISYNNVLTKYVTNSAECSLNGSVDYVMNK